MCPDISENSEAEAVLTEEEEQEVVSDARKAVKVIDVAEEEVQVDSAVKEVESEGVDSSEDIKKGQEKYYGI